MNLTLAELNQQLRVCEVTGQSENVDRLHELGLLKNTLLSVVRKTPFSGPVILKVGSAFIVVRHSDAKNIFVEVAV